MFSKLTVEVALALSLLSLTGTAFANQESSPQKLVFAGIAMGYGETGALQSIPSGNTLSFASAESDRANGEELVLCPERDVVVSLAHGSLVIAKGAIVYVVKSGKEVGIFDLHDTSGSTVTYEENGRRLDLQPGRMIAITEEQRLPDALIRFPFRRLRQLTMSSGRSIYLGEFPVMRAMSESSALQSLRTSEDPRERKIWKKVMKTAAIVQIVSASHGPYSSQQAR